MGSRLGQARTRGETRDGSRNQQTEAGGCVCVPFPFSEHSSYRVTSSFFFREPVDPIRFNIPTYFQIIDPKKARDLSTIKIKLDKGEYETSNAVYADVQLMVDNAIKFNGETSEVAAAAVACQARFRELVTDTLSKKRKPDIADIGRASGTPPVKRARLG